MRNTTASSIILATSALAIMSLSACNSGSSEKEKTSGKVTQTRMDDIDKIEGTINDDMINVDETTESAPLAKNDKKTASTGNEKE